MPKPYYRDATVPITKIQFLDLLNQRVNFDRFGGCNSKIDQWRVEGGKRGYFIPYDQVGDFVRAATQLYRDTWVRPLIERLRREVKPSRSKKR